MTWGAYEIPYDDLRHGQKSLGEGSFSRVKLCQYRSTQVAVKIISCDTRPETDHRKHISREVGLLLRLRHPHILTVLGFFSYWENKIENVCIVTEVCSGLTVDARIFKTKDLPPFSAYTIGMQVCQAVEYIHRQKCQHRDIKAANVMLMTKSLENPLAKLGDFGYSKHRGESSDGRISPGIYPGTPAYMA